MADVVTGLDKISFASIQGGIMDIVVYIVWGVVILAVVYFIWAKYQDKKIFIYPVRILRQRNNGQVKEQNTFGGYIKKGLLTQFIIKQGRFKRRPASKLPLSDLMDEDNRVYYFQISPDAPLVQVRRDFKLDKVYALNDAFKEPTDEEKRIALGECYTWLRSQESNKDYTDEDLQKKATDIILAEIEEMKYTPLDVTTPTYTPVPTDLKQQALMDIANYKNTLGVDVNRQFLYFVAGVIALVIVGAIIFYIAVNKGDVPILTK